MKTLTATLASVTTERFDLQLRDSTWKSGDNQELFLISFELYLSTASSFSCIITVTDGASISQTAKIKKILPYTPRDHQSSIREIENFGGTGFT